MNKMFGDVELELQKIYLKIAERDRNTYCLPFFHPYQSFKEQL